MGAESNYFPLKTWDGNSGKTERGRRRGFKFYMISVLEGPTEDSVAIVSRRFTAIKGRKSTTILREKKQRSESGSTRILDTRDQGVVGAPSKRSCFSIVDSSREKVRRRLTPTGRSPDLRKTGTQRILSTFRGGNENGEQRTNKEEMKSKKGATLCEAKSKDHE